MTRSVTVSNSSNWENENIVIRYYDEEIHLKPGQSYQINPFRDDNGEWVYGEILIEDAQSEKTKPFYKDGNQIIPEIKTGWKECP